MQALRQALGHRTATGSGSSSTCSRSNTHAISVDRLGRAKLAPCQVTRLQWDAMPSLSAEERQLRNAIAAKQSSGNRVIQSLTQLTKTHTEFIKANAPSRTPDGSPVTPSLLSPVHVQGMAQQCDHVTHILKQHAMQITAKDLALLGQACRRLRFVVQFEPELVPHQEALFTELISASLRSPALAQADLLAWATLMHGLAAAGVNTPDMQRLLTSATVHLPTGGSLLAGIPLTSRSRSCARLMWAYVACGYEGDVSPLVAYLSDAITQHDIMSQASPTHWSQLLWSAAKLKTPREQLVGLLKHGLPALCSMIESEEIQVNSTVLSTTCWAVAQADLQPQERAEVEVDRWGAVVQLALDAGAMANASSDEEGQFSDAVSKLGLKLATGRLQAEEPTAQLPAMTAEDPQAAAV